MRGSKKYFNLLIFVLLIFYRCTPQDKYPVLKGPYLGQKPAEMTPEIFAPGIVSTELEEFGCAFTPEGTEFYFTRKSSIKPQHENNMTIMFSRLQGTGWSRPEIAPFCDGNYNEGEPNFSPNGDIVLYGRLIKLVDGTLDPRVFIAERNEDGWSKPQDLMHGMFASMTRDRRIYFTDVSKGYAKGDLYMVVYGQEGLQKPEKLKGKVNSPQQDAHPFVTPSGDVLIFDSNRPGGFGDNDLYICFAKDAGKWSDPVNMGAVVNTQDYEAIPYLSYDGKYLFFFRNKDIYWISARFIESLKSDN